MRVLSPGAVSWYMHELERQLGPDRGLGDSKLRREITSLLRSKLPTDGRERRRLIQLLPSVKHGYLRRWATSVDSANPPSPERLARTLTTYLLDCGHSSGYLNRWAAQLRKASAATLGDLLEGACGLAEQVDQEFEVLIPFVSVPDHEDLASHLPEWLSPPQAARWFAEHGFAQPPRHNGAFIYRFTRKDPVAAARAAGGIVRRLEARRVYARGPAYNIRNRLQPVGKVWIKGEPEPLPLAPPNRGVSVLSLVSEKTMYSVNRSDRLDEALELAAPLHDGSASTAAAGGWAAVESLLYHPGDELDVSEGRAVVADRLAAIVACSWPRAELTTLSYRHRPPTPDRLSQRLDECNTNMQRSQVVADALTDGTSTPLVLTSPHEHAAAKRMKSLIDDPIGQLTEVNRVLSGVFRRLYRQRNIVVHGGSTEAIALDAALRTSAPLIGAALDRLVHAQLIDNEGPLTLAARAENSLTLVGDPLGPGITRLLG
ncbi:integrase [Amycolatopsis alkalitolerans]|uniref:Integrase n=1 Tax=Amycolatopsis alkalitolerans TaxID=2547244 RepID=A0A5C4M8E2_9PSEU|nr:integrase [Amycolatopsis alkalitolerans]TNC28022.1 integrase [Amycolatopsis alkalitolerans]